MEVVQTFNPSSQISEFQVSLGHIGGRWGERRGVGGEAAYERVTEDGKGQASVYIIFTVGYCSEMCSDNPEREIRRRPGQVSISFSSEQEDLR